MFLVSLCLWRFIRELIIILRELDVLTCEFGTIVFFIFSFLRKFYLIFYLIYIDYAAVFVTAP